MNEEQQPWDQIEGESDESYSRFLVYRNMGLSRSLCKASAFSTKNQKTPKDVPQPWKGESVQYSWIDRAHAWDVFYLKQHGQRLVMRFVAAMDAMAGAALEELENTKPKGWGQAVAALETLNRLIPPEVVEHVKRNAERPEHIPDSAGSNGVPRIGRAV